MPAMRYGIIDGIHTEQNIETILDRWSLFPRWCPSKWSTVLLKTIYFDSDGCKETYYYIAKFSDDGFVLSSEYKNRNDNKVRLFDETYWKYLD